MNLEELLREATDLRTQPQRLWEIYNMSYVPVPVLRALAQNPNTPSKTLWRLAEKFPREVLNNDVIPLLQLENPALAQEMTVAAISGFLSLDELPGWLLDDFVRGPHSHLPEVKRAIEQHWQIKGEAGPHWKQAIQTAIANATQVSIEQIDKYARASAESNYELLLKKGFVADWLAEPMMVELERQLRPNRPGISYNDGLPAPLANDAFRPEYGRSSYQVSNRALKTFKRWQRRPSKYGTSSTPTPPPNVPLVDLARLAKTDEKAWEWLRAQLRSFALDTSTPVEVLRVLFEGGGQEEHVVVARHTNTPVDILEALAQNSSSWVRGALARNTALSAYLLAQLVEDPVCIVRAHVARHPNTSLETLHILAHDLDGEVLEALAHRPNLPTDLKTQVEQRLESTWTWGMTRPYEQLARERSAPPHVLEELARGANANLTVRTRVAANPRTPVSTLQILASDPEIDVRIAVADNPFTTEDVLRSLATDDSRVQRRVASNRNTPRDVMEQYLSDEGMLWPLVNNPALPLDLLERAWAEVETRIETFVHKESWSPNGDVTSRNHYQPVTPGPFPHGSKPRLFSSFQRAPHATPEFRQRVRRFRRRDALLSLAISLDEFDRMVALSSLEIPVDVLEANLHSRSWLCRLAIARNPVTPKSMLKTLSKDGNRFVRAWVAERLKYEESAT